MNPSPSSVRFPHPSAGASSALEGSKERLTIVKVGGAIVEDQEELSTLLDAFATIGGHRLLVHGGGRRATKVAEALGIETTMVAGRRVTDARMLEVVTMVYGGLVNKNLVARLQALGVNAVGLTGADMNAVRSHKRPPVDVNGATVDYGFVGDIDRVDANRLRQLLLQGVTPVMAPLTHDGKGHLLNTNADTIAAAVATAFAPFFDVTLRYTFEKTGVLAHPGDESSALKVITPARFRQLKADGTISGGMLPKIENALTAIGAGVKEVRIGITSIRKED